jgi:integrase
LLSDKKIQGCKAAGKPYSKFDSGGLYIYVTKAGTRSWRLKYRFAGKEQRLTLGLYPDVSLKAAREERDAIRKAVKDGRDPLAERQARKLAASNGASFEAMGRDWFERNKATWRESTAQDIIGSLEAEVFPNYGRLHVNDFNPPMCLALIRAIEDRGAITVAKRVRQRMSRVFVHAISCGVGKSDPAAIIAKALTRQPHQRQPAITDLEELRAMLRAIEQQVVYPATKMALRLLSLTLVRPNELRFAVWPEFEGFAGDDPVWRIPAKRMKTNVEHVVPLTAAALDVINAIRILTWSSTYVFANKSNTGLPISRNLMSDLLREAGYRDRHVPHGFRAAFASIMTKRHPGEHEAIEAVLAHEVPGVRGRYMREDFLERRRELMAEWAGLLMDGAPDAKTLLLGRHRN